MTVEDLKRLAEMAGQTALCAYLARLTPPRTPADLLAECQRAAGIATADTTSMEPKP